jgi:hypothetical protein
LPGNDLASSASLALSPRDSALYFAKKADLPKPLQYCYDRANSLGGPIVKCKTLFGLKLLSRRC